MPITIKSCDYFVFVIENRLVYNLLSSIGEAGVNQLAFKSRLIDSNSTEFTIFPNENDKLIAGATDAGAAPNGPFPALIIKSDTDEPGELANIFSLLTKEGIEIVEANGIADIDSHYGVVLYFKDSDRNRAQELLKIELKPNQ